MPFAWWLHFQNLPAQDSAAPGIMSTFFIMRVPERGSPCLSETHADHSGGGDRNAGAWEGSTGEGTGHGGMGHRSSRRQKRHGVASSSTFAARIDASQTKPPSAEWGFLLVTSLYVCSCLGFDSRAPTAVVRASRKDRHGTPCPVRSRPACRKGERVQGLSHAGAALRQVWSTLTPCDWDPLSRLLPARLKQTQSGKKKEKGIKFFQNFEP